MQDRKEIVIMPNQEQDKEAKVDIKGTISKLVEPEAPELTQEEEIMKFGEEKTKKSSSNNGNNDDQGGQNTEEQEHLKRVKQELLESLNRVKILEKKTFGEKDSNKKDFKIEAKKSSISQTKEKMEKEPIETEKDRTRE